MKHSDISPTFCHCHFASGIGDYLFRRPPLIVKLYIYSYLSKASSNQTDHEHMWQIINLSFYIYRCSNKIVKKKQCRLSVHIVIPKPSAYTFTCRLSVHIVITKPSAFTFTQAAMPQTKPYAFTFTHAAMPQTEIGLS